MRTGMRSSALLPSVRGTAAEAARLAAIRLAGRRAAIGPATLELVAVRGAARTAGRRPDGAAAEAPAACGRRPRRAVDLRRDGCRRWRRRCWPRPEDPHPSRRPRHPDMAAAGSNGASGVRTAVREIGARLFGPAGVRAAVKLGETAAEDTARAARLPGRTSNPDGCRRPCGRQSWTRRSRRGGAASPSARPCRAATGRPRFPT